MLHREKKLTDDSGVVDASLTNDSGLAVRTA